MLDVAGTELSAEDRELLLHPIVGGVILFSRNYLDPAQLQALIASIHGLRQPSLLVAVDQEGGRVQRFRSGFSGLPPASRYGMLYQQHPVRAREAAREAGWLMAAELGAAGVDFSFAPVLDLDYGISNVIGDRAFAGDPQVVAELAFAWTQGARQAGMASVGKHFPGHGCVSADSHLELPVDSRPFEELWQRDLWPFRHLIHNGIEGIMPAHLRFPSCNAEPAGFSRFWIQEILRQRLGYQGVVFSDDLSMGGAASTGDYQDRARAALEAGCDMVLVCNNRAGATSVIDGLGDRPDPVSQARLVRMHGRRGRPGWDRLREDPRWHRALRLLADLGDNASLDLDL